MVIVAVLLSKLSKCWQHYLFTVLSIVFSFFVCFRIDEIFLQTILFSMAYVLKYIYRKYRKKHLLVFRMTGD